ncbi:MAG TPA: N-6 DNA methylase, partial [Polyangiaceae bacterium]|nr:N-6 DNA methylase [Polyangiaceae bacterium]
MSKGSQGNRIQQSPRRRNPPPDPVPPLHRAVLQVVEGFLRHRDNAPRAKDAADRPDAILADSVRVVLRLVFFEHGRALGWWDLPRPLTWADFQHASSAFAASTRRPDSRLPGLGAVPFGHAGEIDRGAFDESDWSSVTASVQAARESTQPAAAGPVLWGIDCGAFYEGLLGYRPRVEQGRFCLDSEREHARRSRGCYFTPAALVDAVLDRSLDPLIEAACCRKEPERALLALRICDPACGSGVFLVAAARRVARSLARLRGGTEDVSDEVHGAAMRDSVGACLYGVDVDPIALELCRIALWLVAGGNRLPLTFLDDRLACADALLGATPLQLEGGIPE